MDIKIRLTPEELRGQSGNMNTLMQEYELLFSGTKTILESTNANWSSNLANNFAGKIIAAQKGFSEVVAVLRYGMEAARTGAEHFETVDKSMAKEISDDGQVAMSMSANGIASEGSTIGSSSLIGAAKISAVVAAVVANRNQAGAEEGTPKLSTWFTRIREKINAILHPAGGGSVVSPDQQIHEEVVISPEQQLNELKDRYSRLKEQHGSYNQLCGDYVHDQLLDMGIISGDVPSANGKDFVGMLEGRSNIGTGYQVKTYHDDGKGKEALQQLMDEANGKPVTNVVFSFEQGASMATSSSAGHVVLVSRIQDGMVYFSESMDIGSYWYRNQPGVTAEGTPISMTLDDFIFNYLNKGHVTGIAHLYKD